MAILWSLGFGFWNFAHAAQTNLNGRAFTLPDGFTVELVARAPLVNRPISIAFDEQGRLYATDSSGSSDKGPTQYERKDHRIVRLEDTDGDGRFDKSVVFADKLMFPEGAMFYEGSLYVAAPPQIWKLTDTDGDGIADKREIWHDGKTLTGCANDLHGPYLGPDGWFYWCKGAFAEQRYTLPNGKPFVSRASHIFRARPDGTGLEPVLTGGMDNPVCVAFHSTGERFLSCTFVQPGGGKRDGLLHAVYGGVYGKEQSALDGHPRTGDLMPVMTHMGAAAPCGLTTYRSRVFGADWADNLLACYFNLRKVVRHELIPDGATFKTRDTDLLASDHLDFHPTDVLEDADGSVLIVDTGGWYKICCPTSQLAKPDMLGGIYRVRKVGMPKRDDPRGLKLNWPALKPTELAKLLSDERLYVRKRAVHELGKRGEAAVPALRDVLVAADVRRLTSNAERGKRNAESKSAPPHVGGYPEDARLAAVWSLARIAGPTAREAVRTALNDTDASVRHAALHVVSLWRDTNAVGRVQAVLQTDDAAAQRVAAEALGRLGAKQSVTELVSTANRSVNALVPRTDSGTPEAAAPRVLEHSLIYALIEIGDRDELRSMLASLERRWANAYPQAERRPALGAFLGEDLKGRPSWNPALTAVAAALKRASLIALDQIPDGGLQPELFFSVNGHSVVSKTAVWIASHRTDAGEFFGRQLTAELHVYGESFPVPEPSATAQRLALFAKSPDIQARLADIVRSTGLPKDGRLIALRAMAGAGLKETPPTWLQTVSEVMEWPTDIEVRRQAVTTARAFTPPKQGGERLQRALLSVGEDTFEPADVRLEALAQVGSVALPAPLFTFVSDHLAVSQPALTRSAAAGVLAKAKLTDAQRLALADTMKSVSPLDAPKLLPAFEKSPGEELGLKLVAALKDSAGLRGLRVDSLKPLLAKYPKPVQDAGAELLAALNADAGKQRAHLETLLPTLKDGDVARGQVVFNSQKAACFTCHAIGYRGGKLGPDLTRIGQVRTEMDLLESIVFPSASFVRSYEPFTVVVKGGEDITGIVRKDAPDEVILANGPETEARIARADVVEMRPGKVSLMPDGLEQALTKQELADLLAFLKATKW